MQSQSAHDIHVSPFSHLPHTQCPTPHTHTGASCPASLDLCASSTTQLPNSKWVYYPLPTSTTPMTTPAACCAACRADLACMFWDFNTTSGECALYDQSLSQASLSGGDGSGSGSGGDGVSQVANARLPLLTNQQVWGVGVSGWVGGWGGVGWMCVVEPLFYTLTFFCTCVQCVHTYMNHAHHTRNAITALCQNKKQNKKIHTKTHTQDSVAGLLDSKQYAAASWSADPDLQVSIPPGSTAASWCAARCGVTCGCRYVVMHLVMYTLVVLYT